MPIWPNSDDPLFFDNISNAIDEINNGNYIICGDFNLVLDPDLDYHNYKTVNNKEARDKVLEIIQEKYMIDPFRENNPVMKRYTWRRRHPFQQARLDFFLISENTLPSVKSCVIENSYRSDHSPVLLSLCFNNFTKGKPLWKHNNSMLTDKKYLNIINEK